MIFWYHSLTCVCNSCLILDGNLGKTHAMIEIRTSRIVRMSAG